MTRHKTSPLRRIAGGIHPGLQVVNGCPKWSLEDTSSLGLERLERRNPSLNPDPIALLAVINHKASPPQCQGGLFPGVDLDFAPQEPMQAGMSLSACDRQVSNPSRNDETATLLFCPEIKTSPPNRMKGGLIPKGTGWNDSDRKSKEDTVSLDLPGTGRGMPSLIVGSSARVFAIHHEASPSRCDRRGFSKVRFSKSHLEALRRLL